jgi:predicted ATPase/DNA-binding SARP family transcriptional activator
VARGLRVRMLGGFTVWVGEHQVTDSAWRLRKAKSLVKLLALAPSHRLHREQVTDLIWEDSEPEAASNSLHQVLHVARRALEATGPDSFHYLHLQADIISLCPQEPLWVDVEAFEGAAAKARHSQDPSAYLAALNLYQGDLLPEDLYEDWAAHRREMLRQQCLSLLIELAQLYEDKKDYAQAVEALGRVLTADHAHEVAHRGLMRLYALMGLRQQALRQYQLLRETLQRELEAETDLESQQLYQDILASRFPGVGTAPETRSVVTPAASLLPVSGPALGEPTQQARGTGLTNLPAQLTNFIGREWEMSEVKRLLATTRLLTLTGAGGCGKTRLAMVSSATLAPEYPDGITVVELAGTNESSLVAQSVASALGVRQDPGRPLLVSLSEYLHPRELVLVLDNCEHLVEGCAQLAKALLDACPKLRILVTSREPLHTPGETVWEVLPLSTPDPQHSPTVDSLVRYEAVRLFIDRAQLIKPGFLLTEQNGPWVTQICYRLDGLPLAIEMAAGWVRALSVEQISQLLDDRFRLLTNGSRVAMPHHRTLRAAIDWSYELLSQPEQQVFNRLSVFAGGFTLEAAQMVGPGGCVKPDQMLELLFHLVEKSLVGVEEGLEGAVRYRLLETLRQYGTERLETNEEAGPTRQKHFAFFLQLAEKADQALKGPNQSRWLNVLDKEHDNLRAALGWARESDEEAELRLAGALCSFWRTRGYVGEGLRRVQGALSRSKGASETLRSRALNGAAALAWYQSDYSRAEAFLEESLTLARQLADQGSISLVLNNLGTVAYAQGDYDRAVALREESLALAQELGDKWSIADCLNNLGGALREQGEYTRAKALLEEGLALSRELADQEGTARSLYNLGLTAQDCKDYQSAMALFEESLALSRELADKQGIAAALGNLGLVSQYRRDYHQATTLLAESLALYYELGDRLGVAERLEELAGVACVQEQLERSTRLLGASETLRGAIGALSSPSARAEHECYAIAAREGLGQEAFALAWTQGQAMTMEQVIEYVLGAQAYNLGDFH